MVVDDDEEFTTLYQKYLMMSGYEVIAENQSSKAMEVANSIKPDLFILDLMMPEPDGFILCRMLRANMNFLRTPIIIISALNDEDSKLVALGAGANYYLIKPFRLGDLESLIQKIVREKKLGLYDE